MEIPNIKFIKTHPDAKLPKSNNSEPGVGDTGLDLYSVSSIVIPAKGSNVVQVGLTVGYITPGFWFRIEPRSGLGFKSGIQPHLGIIDNAYRGDLGVKLYNLSDNDHQVSVGDRIAQICLYTLIQPHCEFTDTVYESNRGAKGFGSSGN